MEKARSELTALQGNVALHLTPAFTNLTEGLMRFMGAGEPKSWLRYVTKLEPVCSNMANPIKKPF